MREHFPHPVGLRIVFDASETCRLLCSFQSGSESDGPQYARMVANTCKSGKTSDAMIPSMLFSTERHQPATLGDCMPAKMNCIPHMLLFLCLRHDLAPVTRRRSMRRKYLSPSRRLTVYILSMIVTPEPSK